MQTLAFRTPIRILLFAATPNATGRLRIDHEFNAIRRSLAAEEQLGVVKIDERTAGKAEDLRDALLRLRPHLVHFSGHGTQAEEILLEEHDGEARRIGKQPLAELFGILKDGIRVVVLNACHSRPLAEAVSTHIEHVIGMDDRVLDSSAMDFSVALYKSIVAGMTAAEAFSLAQNTLRLKGLADAEIPVLFSRSPAEAKPTLAPSLIKPTRSPVQVLLILDVLSDNPISRDDVEAHLPDQRSDRHVLKLTDYGARQVLRGHSVDFTACGDAVSRMVADARSRLSEEGPQVHYYVTGRAALPIFTHLGAELSSWADVTLVNQRRNLTWDVIPLTREPPGRGEVFFQVVKGLSLEEPSDFDGRVAVFISNGHPPKRTEIQGLLKAHGSALGGFIEIRAEHGALAVLSADNAAQAMSELAAIFEKIPSAYPHRRGIALFVAGPAPLAFMAGRAINVHTLKDVWLTNHREGDTNTEERAYELAVKLPLKAYTRPPVSSTPQDELDRKRALEAIVERIHLLQRTLRVEHLPRTLAAAERPKLIERLRGMSFATETRGDDFNLDVVEGTIVFGEGLIEALRTVPAIERARVGQSLFLHELFHFDQNLRSATCRGVGRAGVVLEEVDFWADAMAVATLTNWEVSRRGEDGKERAREFTVDHVDAVLAGIEAFDRFEQGSRIERLYERRLRRYLIWHLERIRAQTVKHVEDADALLEGRLIVEIAPLRGHLDERFDKVVDAPHKDAEFFVALQGKLIRSRPVRHGAEAIIEAIRGFDRAVLGEAMQAVRDQHVELLVPWAQ